MTTFTTETKSQLAKLLATENIRVEHKKLPTAAFDPKNRVLYCPIWKDMSGYMYDLLMGHEVGHALYTPADGWHDASCANGKNFKAFLNVVEDARIEKKIKRKYPGLRSSFVRAYKELMGKDFFGLNGRDINTMSFINRLNIYTKSDYTASINFGAKEKELVDRVRAAETWEDVLKITGDVWQYAKEEKEENDLKWEFPSGDYGNESEEYEDFDDSGYDNSDYDDDSDGQDSTNSESSNDSDEEGEEEGKTKSKSNEFGEDDGDTEDGEINRHKFSEDYSGSMGEPTCETDSNFRNRESELLDDKSRDYVYVTLPKPNLEKIVTPASRVHELISEYQKKTYDMSYIEPKLKSACDDFKKRNEKYISLLAKEFEMRKAASRYAKAKVSNTGDIDISRLYKYQVDDNIFRKTMKVPNGKSHGLVLVFDRSGSMHNNMKGSIEQMLVLAMFCRKVNIPFVVYGFGNNINGRYFDFPNETYEAKNVFSKNDRQIILNGVFLREYINSKMSNAEFTKVFRNMVYLMYSYESRYNSSLFRFGLPQSEELSNTPLNETLLALEPITQEFRKVNNLDIVNTVLIHDGDSDWFRGSFIDESKNEFSNVSRYNTTAENVFVVDKKLKKEFRLTDDKQMQNILMNWYTLKTGSKIFGFYIGGSTKTHMRDMIVNNYVDEKGNSFDAPKTFEEKLTNDKKIVEMIKDMKKSKFVTSYKNGYNKFFLICGGKELEINDGEFEFDSGNSKVTAKKLATAFMKFNEKRQVNRVLVQKFIEGIAV